MTWQVEFTDVALKSLNKMDKQEAALIIGYIEKKLVGDIDPRSFGKPLVSNHKGKWRYRIGDYRILCRIEDQRVVIVIVLVGNRSSIYK